MSLSLKASAINDSHYNYALDQLILITTSVRCKQFERMVSVNINFLTPINSVSRHYKHIFFQESSNLKP